MFKVSFNGANAFTLILCNYFYLLKKIITERSQLKFTDVNVRNAKNLDPLKIYYAVEIK